jgi:hypothetical protein
MALDGQSKKEHHDYGMKTQTFLPKDFTNENKCYFINDTKAVRHFASRSTLSLPIAKLLT